MKTKITLVSAIIATALYAFGLFMLIQYAENVLWTIAVQSQLAVEELDILLQ